MTLSLSQTDWFLDGTPGKLLNDPIHGHISESFVASAQIVPLCVSASVVSVRFLVFPLQLLRERATPATSSSFRERVPEYMHGCLFRVIVLFAFCVFALRCNVLLSGALHSFVLASSHT